MFNQYQNVMLSRIHQQEQIAQAQNEDLANELRSGKSSKSIMKSAAETLNNVLFHLENELRTQAPAIGQSNYRRPQKHIP